MDEEKLLEKERRRQRALRIIKHWRLMDDRFMKCCLKNNIPAVECILQIILERKDLRVQKVVIEDTIPNLRGRGIRMDVHAIDAKGKEYNIEVQRSNEGAARKRARFNSSLLDLNALKASDDFEQLPETYVIFITENDVMGAGLPRYHVERTIQELQHQLFADEEHIIYVNGAYEGTDDIGKLMHDFRCRKAEDMFLEPLRETVYRYKETPEGVNDMYSEMEKWEQEEREAGRVIGKAEGQAEARHEMALEMLKDKFPLTTIVKLSKLSLEQIQKIAKDNHLATV